MRGRTKLLLVVALLAGALTLPGTGSSAPMVGQKIEALPNSFPGPWAWTPESTEVELGGTVNFANGTTGEFHGIEWTTAPPKLPECSYLVPVNTTAKGFDAPCKFVQPGVFNFRCTYHPYMTGHVTVPPTGIPLATTSNPGASGDTTGLAKGLVDPHGEETKWWVEYGTTTGYGSKTPELTVAGTGTSDVAESASISGLATGTVYHYRMVAKNASGESKGEDNSFRTTGAPVVTTEAATAIGKVEATLHGTVNPNGHEATYYFEYGTTTAYGSKSVSKLAGTGTNGVAATIPIAGLTAGTTYHYRVVGKNSVGTSPGNDLTLTTVSNPPPPPPEEQRPEVGPAFGSAKVSAATKAVKVSIQVLQAGIGGHLKIELRTRGHKLAGVLNRSGMGAGPLRLTVPLNAKAKKTLNRAHKLALTVKITLTGASGNPTTVTKSVVVHG